MAAPNNPAGSNTPAQNTMQVAQYTAGARTRNIINIANPGGTGDKAYSFTAATSSPPEEATDGYPNFHSQRYLHVTVINNGESGGSATVKVYAYHSYSGQWGRLMIPGDQTDSDTKNQVKITAGQEDTAYAIIPIRGIERIFLTCDTHPGSSAAVDVYLGVNSF